MPLTITAANIIPVAGYSFGTGVSGGTLTAGMPVYKDASDSDKIKAADANASDAAAAAVGITLHAALTGQPVKYITGGNLGFGAILTAGLVYVVGATTAGDIEASTALTTNWRTSILGVATTTSNLALNIIVSGATV